MEIALSIFGYILLWAATDVGRKGESEVKFMRGKWWLIFLLVTIGVFVIENASEWTHGT